MSHYINDLDITDTVVREFVTKGDERVSTWMTRVDDEIDRIGEGMDIDPSDFIWAGDDDTSSTLMHPKILEYARVYFCMMCCEDNIGANSMNPSQDEVYMVKAKWYSDRCKDLRGQLTTAMFTLGDADLTAEETVGQGGLLWRG